LAARPESAVLFDTSVLVAAMVTGHKAHERCRPWLSRVREGELRGHVNGHSLMELYAVLTTLPVQPRIGPSTARRMIRENVESICKIGTLTPADYTRVADRMATLDLQGGVVYDALAARLAERLQVDALLTLNPRDFRRVWPEGSVIREP